MNFPARIIMYTCSSRCGPRQCLHDTHTNCDMCPKSQSLSHRLTFCWNSGKSELISKPSSSDLRPAGGTRATEWTPLTPDLPPCNTSSPPQLPPKTCFKDCYLKFQISDICPSRPRATGSNGG